jgi:hypothetical protein
MTRTEFEKRGKKWRKGLERAALVLGAFPELLANYTVRQIMERLNEVESADRQFENEVIEPAKGLIWWICKGTCPTCGGLVTIRHRRDQHITARHKPADCLRHKVEETPGKGQEVFYDITEEQGPTEFEIQQPQPNH